MHYITNSNETIILDPGTINRLNHMGATVHRRSGQQIVRFRSPQETGRGYKQRHVTLSRFVFGEVTSKHKAVQKVKSNDYRRSNLTLINHTEHARRRRTLKTYELDGKRMCLTEISTMYGVPMERLRSRLRRSWTIKQAISHR
jgi:hypothetical protein